MCVKFSIDLLKRKRERLGDWWEFTRLTCPKVSDTRREIKKRNLWEPSSLNSTLCRPRQSTGNEPPFESVLFLSKLLSVKFDFRLTCFGVHRNNFWNTVSSLKYIVRKCVRTGMTWCFNDLMSVQLVCKLMLCTDRRFPFPFVSPDKWDKVTQTNIKERLPAYCCRGN